MGKQATQRELISAIRFGRHGARLLARQGHSKYAKQYRSGCRNRIAELRELRASEKAKYEAAVKLVNELNGGN